MTDIRCPVVFVRSTVMATALGFAQALFALDHARADYPERQVTMIVCFPAGGGTDIAARLINTQLGEALGKPVMVRTAAAPAARSGSRRSLRAGGDGHTLLVCSSAYVVNPSLYAQAAYDPFKDFVPIMVIGASPNAFVVPPQSEIKSMPELIAKAKANPGKLNWTSPGAGTTPHLAGEVLEAAHRHPACSTSRSPAPGPRPRPCSADRSTSIPPISAR